MMYRLPLPDVPDNHEPEGEGPVPAPCNNGIQVRKEIWLWPRAFSLSPPVKVALELFSVAALSPKGLSE